MRAVSIFRMVPFKVTVIIAFYVIYETQRNITIIYSVTYYLHIVQSHINSAAKFTQGYYFCPADLAKEL